jgi:hypothetical protein
MKKLMEELMIMRRRETEVMTITQRGKRLQEASLSLLRRNASMLKNS